MSLSQWVSFSHRLHAFMLHAAFLTIIALVAYDIWNGNAKPGAAAFLAAVISVYAAVMLLLRHLRRHLRRAASQDAIDYYVAPDKLRKKRSLQRHARFFVLVVAGVILVIAGEEKGIKVDGLPAQYLGYFSLAVAALHSLREVNLWHGTPLDPRFDPPASQEDDSDVPLKSDES